MPIQYSPVGPQSARHQWELRGEASVYALSLLPDGSGLVCDYWGDFPGYSVRATEVDYHTVRFRTRQDQEPVDYSLDGMRVTSLADLSICVDGQEFQTRWAYKSFRISQATGNDRRPTLVIEFEDSTLNLIFELIYELYEEFDVVCRSIRVSNFSDQWVTLSSVMSASWNINSEKKVSVGFLHGDWGDEFHESVIEMDHGQFSLGSRAGLTGHA